MMGKYILKVAAMAMLVCCQSSDDDTTIPMENLPANNWQRDVNNPVLESVDTLTNISDPTVIYQGKFQMWAGCVGTDVTFASICYSESADGINWSDPIVVFTPSNAAESWDNQKTEIPTVIYDENEPDASKRYKMWYGGAAQENRDLIKVGYAYSEDGINWNRLPASLSLDQQAGLVLVPGFEVGDAGVVSDPTSVVKDGTYHIWYNSFGANNDIMISHATSSNGYDWVKDSSNPVMIPEVNWEDQGPGEITKDVSHPVVLVDNIDGNYFMWFGSFDDSDFETYSGLGFAHSRNGSSWTKNEQNPIFEPALGVKGEQLGLSTGAAVLKVNDIYHLFYGGVDENGRRVINHATSQ